MTRLIYGKPAVQATYQDLEQLKKDGRREDRFIEYKTELPAAIGPGGRNKGREDFLKDVSSFANADGGCIIYGVKETGGVPVSLAGIPSLDMDRETLRLQDWARVSLDPPLSSLHFCKIHGKTSPFLLVDVPRSFQAPHRIIQLQQYWWRRDAGNDPMPHNNLRQAFLERDLWLTDAVQFRDKRRAVWSNERFTPGRVPGFLLLEVLPLGRLREVLEIEAIGSWRSQLSHFVLQTLPKRERHNLEGCLQEFGTGDERTVFQYFRNGGLEVMATLKPFVLKEGGNPLLNGQQLEVHLRRWVRRGVEWLALGRQEPPFVLFLMFSHARTWRIGTSAVEGHAGCPPHDVCFEYDAVPIPELVLEDTSAEAVNGTIDRMLDMMWQAAGWEGSP